MFKLFKIPALTRAMLCKGRSSLEGWEAGWEAG
jgi:hypothetical protein